MHDHVGHDLEGLVEVFVDETGVHDGVFPRGSGVELAAEAVEYLGYLQRVEARAALEQQVFDEVADAALIRLLITRPGPDPEPEGNGADGRQLLADDPPAAFQLFQLIALDLGQPP